MSTGQKPIHKIIDYAKNDMGEIRLASLYSILNKVFDLAPPILIGQAVEIVVNPQDNFFQRLGYETLLGQITLLSIVTVAVWVLESFFEFLYQVKWRNLAQKIQSALRTDTYDHLQILENKYFENQKTGNLISIVNDDVNQLERFLDVGANDILQVSTTVIVIGSMYFYLSPEVAWLSFLPIPIIILGGFYFQKKIEPLYLGVREKAGSLSSFLTNNFQGISTIKAYCAEALELKKLKNLSDDYAHANARAIKLSASFSPLIRMAVLMGFLATLIYGGVLVEKGILKVGIYSTMIFMIQRLLWPLTRLASTVDLYQRAMASAARIFNLLDTTPTIRPGNLDKLAHADESNPNFAVEYKNINFGYREDLPIIKDLSIKIDHGKTIGLVGLTGSGKSTLIKLLLRLYDPQSGEIQINNTSISDLQFHTLRNLFSYVGQDNYLFDGTILENLKFAKPDSSLEQIHQAAQMAEIHDFIMSLPYQYATVIGERGQKLSGGQRQRLSIARALLKDAPIFLFDEATSSVDNETEAAIQRSLDQITQKKTTIIIAHRLSTIVKADQIYVLDKGQIVQSGTHQELIKQDGLYQGLWNVQTGL
jgi:ATP-binding cassette subfamily B protein